MKKYDDFYIAEDHAESVRKASEYQGTERFTSAIGEIETEKVYLVSEPGKDLRFERSLDLAIRLSESIPVLYINAGRSKGAVRKFLADRSAGETRKLEWMHFTGGKMTRGFADLCNNMMEQETKVVILGTFELLATTERERAGLVSQIEMIACDQGAAVIVFSKEPLARLRLLRHSTRGPMGLLAALSEEPMAAGPSQEDDEEPGENKEEPLYKKLAREYEAEVAANPPPPDPINEIPFWEFTDEETVGPESWNAIMEEFRNDPRYASRFLPRPETENAQSRTPQRE
jgi:hypothetical protein